MKLLYYSPKNKQSGFTLVELLIAMTIGLIMLAALSSTFLMQRKIYDVQEQIVEMVQTARAAMDMMSREIRMAGYYDSTVATMQRSDPAGADFVGIPCNSSQLQIVADLNGDEETDGSTTDDDTNEDITYSYDAANFQIDRDTGGGGQPFAENIQLFTFNYLNSAGSAATATADIRQIKITIIVGRAKPDPDSVPYTLTSLITPRNLGL